MNVLVCSQVKRSKYSNAEWQTLKSENCWFKTLYQCPFGFIKVFVVSVRTFPQYFQYSEPSALQLTYDVNFWAGSPKCTLVTSLLHCLVYIFNYISYFLHICVCVWLFVCNKFTLQNVWGFLISSCFVHHSLG